ncbi:MAG: FG-GAP repeat protein [Acidobacteria bacterium]|nr:FG-GAP repeat protein [Acidobacteriota bacterium]
MYRAFETDEPTSPMTRPMVARSLTTTALMALLLAAASGAAGREAAPPPTFLQGPATAPARTAESELQGRGLFLAEGLLEPLSLATADFDRDGIPDLVVGYGGGEGYLALFLGSPEALRGGGAGGAAPAPPFLGPVAVIATSETRFLAAGDFDRDGLPDLVAAGSQARLTLFPGDGEGSFGPPRERLLPGTVTALAAGEIHRRDGLPDLAVALEAPEGSRLLIFQSVAGSWAAAPEALPLPTRADSLAFGSFLGGSGGDLLVAAGGELLGVIGRDARDSEEEDTLRLVTLDTPAPVQRLAAGSSRRGEVHWSAPGGDAHRSISSRPNQAIEIAEPSLGSPLTWALGQPDARAVLPMRLDSDARPDAVVLFDAMEAPLALYSRRGPGFVVDSAGDEGDALPGDTICATGTGTCTFRAALDESNALAGMQTITFSISGSPLLLPGSLLAATDPVEIDGTTQSGGAVFVEDTVFVGLGCQISLGGGLSLVRGLALTDACLIVEGGGGNVIEGNFFGTDPTLTTVGTGSLSIRSDSNLVGGTAPGSRNFFVNGGLDIGGGVGGPTAFDNRVLGNSFGVDIAGTGTVGGSAPITVGSGTFGASGNEIGGSAPLEGNLLGGCIDPLICAAVTIVGTGTTDTLIQGNRIGTDAAGAVRLPGTQGTGILVDGASGTLIGGTAPMAPNVLAGNDTGFAGQHGILLVDIETTGNHIEGNFIGTNLGGTAALGGYEDGVRILRAGGNTVGGSATGAGNVIGGNSGDGIHVEDISSAPASGNTVLGNRIGTTASGSAPLPNGDDGIYNESAKDTVVGAPGAGNVIGANTGDGIEVLGASCKGLVIQGNQVGTDPSAVLDLGNGGFGLRLVEGEENLIGGSASGAGNTFAFNGEDGVGIATAGPFADENRISRNSFFSNADLGIDLDFNGPSPNDPDDPDSFANQGQNFPVVTAAVGPIPSVTGTLDSLPSTEFTLEFFASGACDASGHGEAERYLGSLTVTTDGAGDAAFSAGISGSLAEGELVTATATDPAGNTSELSACTAVNIDPEIFSDGFESGDTSAWSGELP